MARTTPKALWRRHVRLVSGPAENRYLAGYRAAMEVLKAKTKPTPEPFNLAKARADVAAAMRPHYESALRIGARSLLLGSPTMAKAIKDGARVLKAAKAKRFLTVQADNLSRRVMDTVNTSYDAISAAMEEAIGEGLSGDELDLVLDQEWDDILGRRSSDIAVTEIAGAVNSARDYVMREVVEFQDWVDAADERVRATHVIYGEAGKKPVGFDWSTLLGTDVGYVLLFPGDPECTELGEIVSCRCFCAPAGDVEMDPADLEDFLEGFGMDREDLATSDEQEARWIANESKAPRQRVMLDIVKGDVEGHPFRGNQYTDGSGGASDATGGGPSGPKFEKWFGGSKVVDSEGKPLVVYHGSSKRFTSFELDQAGSQTDAGYLGHGFYFGDREHAGMYAHLPSDQAANAAEDENWRGDPFIPVGGKSALFPVYLSLKNPLQLHERPDPKATHRAQDREVHIREELGLPKKATAKEVTEEAKRRGHDGVIFHYAKPLSIRSGAPTASGSKEYVVFDPGQIKSSIGNQGTFDPNDPDITKGDLPGHEFRGNQWTEGAGGGDSVSYSPADTFAVELYAGNEDDPKGMYVPDGMNGMLRGVGRFDEGAPQKYSAAQKAYYRKRTAELQAIIERTPTTSDSVFYRGVDYRLAGKLTDGSEFTDKGFTAVTSDRDIAQRIFTGFGAPGGKVFEVRIPKGTPLLDIDRVLNPKNDPEYTTEREFLLGHGTRFIVKGDTLEVVR